MPPEKLNYKMSIPSEFQDKWDLFKSKAESEEIDFNQLIRNLIEKYLEDYEELEEEFEAGNDDDFDESALLAKLTGSAEYNRVPEKPVPVSRKVKVKKPVVAKKKSFLSKRATITKKKEEDVSEEYVTIKETPKFLLLELVRKLDKGNGINPDDLVSSAEEKGIVNPRLQMNKMVRRGILYIHLDRVHVT